MKLSNHETEIVSPLLRAVADHVGARRFQLWFSGTRWEYDEGTVVIRGVDGFRMQWLESKMRKEIATVCHTVTKAPVEVRFHVVDSTSDLQLQAGVSVATTTAETAIVGEPSRGPDRSSSQHPPAGGTPRKYATLDEFVVGPCNQLATASTRMVMEQPGQINPLYLYGPPGSGKTHLAESVFSAIRARPGTRRCVFLTAEQFTSYFLTSLHGRGIPSFRQRYRHVDLLVIEDLQFLANKPATVQELQHTMDAVLKDGGQLTFTADRSPAELAHLGQELINRMCGGMVTRLQPLDAETQRYLVMRIARERGIAIDEAVAELLADKLVGDARYACGALLRLQAFSTAWNRPITPDLVLEALDDLFQIRSRVVRLDDIQRVVCEVFGIDSQKLKSKNRTQRITQPRMLAMWLARKHTSSALSEIGDYFGNRSHSTVVMAEKKINALMAAKSHVRIANGNMGVSDVLRRIEQQLMVS